MNAREKTARDNDIVAARMRGLSWTTIAGSFGLTERQCQNILADYRASRPRLRERDPIEIVDDLIDRYEAAQEELALVSATTKIVITDRRVLDRQMRRQIAQFEQVAGVVRSVTDSSTELLEALRSTQAKIITTTLQKFPFVLQKIDEEDGLSTKTYAVIVDEAHSSQSGETAADLKQLLGSLTPEDLDLDEDDGTPAALLARLAARGRQPNLSFFAFTATPKAKTLELFGSKDSDGKPRAFHTYSMRQAIEEKFIVDVLANYTTYEQLFRLETAAEETIEVPSGQTSRRLARFTELHPYVKSQKAAVVIDHFKRVVRPLLGGQGKAMVVCESREEAVQWKRALEQEIARHAHEDVKVLVAFSR